MRTTTPPPPHPLVALAESRGLSRREVWNLVGISESLGKQYVSGHCRASWQRARDWEEATHGAVHAEDVMRWQDEHCKAAA